MVKEAEYRRKSLLEALAIRLQWFIDLHHAVQFGEANAAVLAEIERLKAFSVKIGAPVH